MSDFRPRRAVKVAAAVWSLVWITAARAEVPDFPQMGPGAMSMARECYAPRIDDPNYIIMECQKFIDNTWLSGQPFAYASIGTAYMRLGKFEKAITYLGMAIALSKKHYKYLPNFYSYRCIANLDYGKPEDALKDCDAALALQADNVWALDFRGDVKYRMHDYAGAIADLTAALAIDPKSAGSQYVRGLARMRNGDAAGGQADIAAAQVIDPKIAQQYVGFDKQQ